MATLILVAGAGLGASAWERVTPRLEDRGHTVRAVGLTGFGECADLATPEIDLTTHTADVVAALDRVEEAVLVGHSYGAMPAVAATQARPDRVERLVLVAGAWVPDGQSMFDAAPEQGEMMQALADAVGDGWRVPFLTADQIDQFFGDHGLSADDHRWLQERATSQPIGIYRTPLRRDDAVLAAQAPVYVRCTGDRVEAPVGVQDGWEVVDLDAGHWPMVSAPDRVADLLDRLARVPPASAAAHRPVRP